MLLRGVLAVLVLAGVLAGCSAAGGEPDDTAGATALSDGSAKTQGSVKANPIPPVRDPKNLAAIVPCLLLTPAQREANRIDQPGRPQDVLGSPGCKWNDRARTREVAVFVDIGNDVLGNIYAQRDAIPVFELTEVAGQPAIRTQDNVDGTCYFRVAAAEAQTLIVRFTSLRQGREEPCRPAKALAATIIGNLPPLTGASPPA